MYNNVYAYLYAILVNIIKYIFKFTCFTYLYYLVIKYAILRLLYITIITCGSYNIKKSKIIFNILRNILCIIHNILPLWFICAYILIIHPSLFLTYCSSYYIDRSDKDITHHYIIFNCTYMLLANQVTECILCVTE